MGASDVLSFATGASNGSAPWTSIPTPWSATDTRGLLPSLYENTVSTTASVFRGARDVAEVLAATLGGAAFAIAALSKRLATLPLKAGSGAASTALGMLVASTKGVGRYGSQLRLTTREAYTDGWQRTQAALQGAESRLVDVGNRTTTQVANIAHSSADKVYSLQQLGADKAGQLVDKAKGTIGSVVEGGACVWWCLGVVGAALCWRCIVLALLLQCTSRSCWTFQQHTIPPLVTTTGKEVAGVAASTAYQAAGTVEGYAEGALHAANDTIKAGVGSAKHALENTVGPPAASAVSTLARGFEQGRGAVASVVHGAAETAAAVTPDHVPSVGEVGCATKRATKEGIDAAAATAKKGVDVVLGPVSNC